MYIHGSSQTIPWLSIGQLSLLGTEANQEAAELPRQNGDATMRNGDFEKAVRWFHKAAQMSPDDLSMTAVLLAADTMHKTHLTCRFHCPLCRLRPVSGSRNPPCRRLATACPC